MATRPTSTLLKSMDIVKFRGLENLRFNLGAQVTLICGKNGTSKSSLLGIAAQIFSFERDNNDGTDLTYRSITGKQYKSLPREHFRFSQKHDGPASMSVNFKVFDGYSGSEYESSLELTTRTTESGIKKARPVVRGNTSIPNIDNTSRNYTHPVIYLSLRRLIPITSRTRYVAEDYEYLAANRDNFINKNNELLNKSSTAATGTKGTVNSAVAFGENYNEDSVSAGEDNAGQIILALLSFRKLKSEYKNYHGGLLLIDEADAGLFPAAQLKLIDMLHRECNELGIQVIMTSHSPTMIEHVHTLSKTYARNFKTLYLTDTYGRVEALNDLSWPEIYADIHTTTVKITEGSSLPIINVYFEDAEAADFYSHLLFRQPANKITKKITQVSLGCDNYLQLIKAKVDEFSTKSLVVLDADARKKADGYDTVLVLPSELPPDQLIFEYLYNHAPDDDLWRNSVRFTRKNLTNIASEIISELNIRGENISLQLLISQRLKGDKDHKNTLRKIFKKFYKNEEFQKFLKSANPWKKWAKDNDAAVQEFRNDLNTKLTRILKAGYGVDSGIVATLLPVHAARLAKPDEKG